MSTEHRTSVNIPLAGEDEPRAPRSRKRRPPRRRVIFICAAALIFAAALCLLLFFGLPEGPAASRTPAGNASVEFVVMQPETTRPFGSGVLALSGSGYTWYNERGSSSGFISIPMQDPVLLCAGSRFLCYSRGGRSFYTADATERYLSLTAEGNIIHADFNEKHQIALVTDAEYHKGEASVYRKDGTRIFTYRSGDAYPYLCALSPDGNRLALAMLLSDETGNAATALYCFSLKSDSLEGSLLLPGEVIRNVSFHAAKGITLITETSVIRTDSKATELSRFELPAGSVLHYALCGDTAVLFTDRREAGYRFDVISVDVDSRELARISTNTEYTSIAGSTDHVALLSAAGVEVYTADLTLLSTGPEVRGIVGISFAEDGRLCTLTPGGASLTALR